MVILHIAMVGDNPYSGVSVVVPKHIESQRKLEKVALLNIEKKCFVADEATYYEKLPRIKDLPHPFNNPDIIVFHEVFYPIYMRYAKEIINKIPYVVVPHGCLTKKALERKKIKKTIGKILCFNKFVNSAIAVQCLSQYEEGNTVIKNKKIIGTNGIDIPLNKKNTFNNEQLKLIFIGRLDIYHKGLDILLQAINNKKELFADGRISLDIYGPDVRGSKLQIESMINKFGLKDIISVNDGITGDSKKRKLLEADVFVQTSRFEGMPMGILEALSYGIPCMITRGTTLGEFVEEYDAGWVAETSVESVNLLFEKMYRERELICQKAQNAAMLASREFGWEIISKKNVLEYKKLIGTGEDNV